MLDLDKLLEIKLPHISPTLEEAYQHKGFLLVLKNKTVQTFDLDYGWKYHFESYITKKDFDEQTNALECYYEITSTETGIKIIETFPDDLIEVWMCDI